MEKRVSNKQPNNKKYNSNTALRLAIKNFDDIEIISLLLEKNINALNDDSETALEIAIKLNKTDFAELILDKINEDKKKIDLLNLLQVAAWNQNTTIFQRLIDRYTSEINYKFIPKEIIIEDSLHEYLKIFLDRGFSVNPNDKDDYQLIFIAVKRGLTRIVSDLLELGVKVGPDSPNKSLLFIAVRNRDTQIAIDLIKHDACLQVTNESGNTLLHTAAANHFETIIQILLDHKAQADVENNTGMTPLHLACFEEANVEEVIKKLLKYNANIEHINNKSETPLHIACKNLNFKAVKMLIANNANINAKNIKGSTPLHRTVQLYCARSRLKIPIPHNKCLHLIEILVKHNADINADDNSGESPLILACKTADALLTKILLGKPVSSLCK